MLWEKVSFVENSKKLFNLLFRGWFRIKGRSSRLEYILRFLMMWLLAGIFFITDELDKLITNHSHLTLVLSVIFLFIVVSLFILSIIQVFFVTHRRLHDLNASGWWQLITFIPLGQLLMICFIFFKGTKGNNKYGSPPEY